MWKNCTVLKATWLESIVCLNLTLSNAFFAENEESGRARRSGGSGNGDSGAAAAQALRAELEAEQRGDEVMELEGKTLTK